MNKYRKVAVLFLIIALVLPLLVSPAAASSGKKDYIVVYHAGIDPDLASIELASNYSADVVAVYRHALRGSFVRANEQQIQQIAADPNVAFVEANQEWSIDAQVIPTGLSRIFADTNPNLSINGVHDFTVDADVAVIDTGIDLDHPELNVVAAINCTLSGPSEGTCAGVKDDGHGHGSHVAGIIGARDNTAGVVGVAPGVRLWAVKVLTNYGSGTTAQIIAGIDYVAAHADAIEVANMSLGGTGESVAMDLAISNAVDAGVTFVLSAGNSNIDVNNYHPAGNPDAITVSALADYDGLPGGLAAPTCYADIDDTRANFSNYGAGVDIAAPGVCIYSTYMNGGYATMSGTSQAAPYVTGAAALLASTNLYATPADIKAQLIATGNFDWVDDSPDGILEPLLDVSDTTIYNPVMLTTAYPITLTVRAFKSGNVQMADLTWSGATSANIDVYRDGNFVLSTVNDGFFTDTIGYVRETWHSYRICEQGSTSICSTTITIQY
jgi:subtilisin